MNDLHFLPSLRRGLIDHVSPADPGDGGLDPAELSMGLTVAGTEVDEDVRLLAPHHVASIAPAEIVRRYPVPGALDVEPNYFPHIEFRAPDLPWRYTPARAGTNGRLRPWLALAVVDEADGVAYSAGGGPTGILSVAAEQLHQLPPSDELWGWAHVQSSRTVEEVVAAVDDEPEALLSRIVCPRRLEPGRSYRAALVNVFTAGADDRSEPAWTTDTAAAVELVVHDTWTFTTAATAGDFESLCELLEPASEVGELGVRAVDVTEPGLEVDWPSTPMVVDLVGALADPGVITDDRPPGTADFTAVVEPILDDVLGRADDPDDPEGDYDPLKDDPVVGLPFYGSWPAKATEVPDVGWARALNLQTTRRMAAGLGARTVRHNQEELMAAAWDQLGSIREAADELNRSRLGAEIGRCWQARVAAVEPGDRLGLAAPLLSFVAVGGAPANDLIAESRVPTGMVDRVWMRRAPRARGASAAGAYVDATVSEAGSVERRAFDYQSIAEPVGLSLAEVELSAEDKADELISAEALAYVEGTGLATFVGGASLSDYVLGAQAAPRIRHSSLTAADGPVSVPETIPVPGTTPVPSDTSVAAVADAVAELDPLMAMRSALVARIPALEQLLPAGELPAGLALAPEFTDPLFWDLAELDDDVIVPGLGEFPNNRVRLLAVNAGFVGAYLVGANNQMSSEFLWREYPTDLAATFFARFFDYGEPSTVDITPIAGWLSGSSIGSNLPNAAATTVILIRGDLIRRYPEVNVFLAPQEAGGRPDYENAVLPSFEGRLGGDVLVVGFPEAPELVLGKAGSPEYFVVLEERMVAPRFGLDVGRDGELTTWDELAWTDFDAAEGHIGVGSIPGLGKPELDDGVVWGRNAAHLAAAVHQRPFRRLYPATELVGDELVVP